MSPNGSSEFLSQLYKFQNSSLKSFLYNECLRIHLKKSCTEHNLDWKLFEVSFYYWTFFKIDWIVRFNVDPFLTISPFGWCKTFNIIEPDRMFHKNSVTEYIRYKNVENSYPNTKVTLNMTDEPLYSTKKEIEFHGYILLPENRFRFCNFENRCIQDALHATIIIHSASEMTNSHLLVEFLDYFLDSHSCHLLRSFFM